MEPCIKPILDARSRFSLLFVFRFVSFLAARLSSVIVSPFQYAKAMPPGTYESGEAEEEQEAAAAAKGEA